ncbi:hypothetical protein Acid345_4227 [Candidatus Koribacter versatilis Ellin345]|uniref:Uncharacterized protein n=1 Tax=Koribacter versatilis (strain Ellin345) TaxID=204669 RepID=Q1IIS3_KORVE|nr:hypothetical protein Acid345_4227 [Candidatus Koribacter versatilis Ellin345]
MHTPDPNDALSSQQELVSALFLAIAMYLIVRDVFYVRAGGTPPSRRELFLTIGFSTFWIGAISALGVVGILSPSRTFGAVSTSALMITWWWTRSRLLSRGSGPIEAFWDWGKRAKRRSAK